MAKKPKRSTGHPNSWGDEKKVQVVTTYLSLGTGPLTSAVTGVPVNTIRQWRLQPWWQELEDVIKQEDDSETDAKLKKIVNKSLDLVMDRLENGELRYDSGTDSFSRSPIQLKIAQKVSTEMLTKRDLLRNRKVQQVDQQSIQDHLANIADNLAALTQPKLVTGITIEGTTNGPTEVA